MSKIINIYTIFEDHVRVDIQTSTKFGSMLIDKDKIDEFKKYKWRIIDTDDGNIYNYYIYTEIRDENNKRRMLYANRITLDLTVDDKVKVHYKNGDKFDNRKENLIVKYI